jgi:hypothetical protein
VQSGSSEKALEMPAFLGGVVVFETDIYTGARTDVLVQLICCKVGQRIKSNRECALGFMIIGDNSFSQTFSFGFGLDFTGQNGPEIIFRVSHNNPSFAVCTFHLVPVPASIVPLSERSHLNGEAFELIPCGRAEDFQHHMRSSSVNHVQLPGGGS